MVDRILVPFRGEGAGEEDLTWAQIGLWEGIRVTGRSVTMGAATPVPPGTTVEFVASTLAFVVGRHQALRTRLRLRDEGQLPRQVCSSEGEAPLEVVDAGDEDPTEVAASVQARYKEVDFDYEHEWPVRMAAIRKDGAVTHMVAVYLHLALDAGGLAALVSDLFARDPATGAAAGPVTAVQPLEQARRQRGAAARRQSAASMRHLEHVLRTMHPRQLGEPRYDDEGFRMIRYRTPATALAIRRIAAQEGVNTSSALLAVFAVGLARFTGHSPVMAMLMVNNRFRPGFAESVSPLVQLSPYLIDVADVSLGEAVGRARTSVLNAYKNAYYDPYAQEASIDRVKAERGEIDYSCFYNDRRQLERDAGGDTLPTDEEIDNALALAEHDWEHRPDMQTRRLFLNVEDAPDALDLVLSADTRYFCEADMVTLTSGMEKVAVRTALTPTQPTGVGVRIAAGVAR
jgi:hypothetical protein